MTTRITKKDYFSAIRTIVGDAENRGFTLPEGMTFDGMNEFVAHELDLLDSKAAAAAKRAAEKKAAGDELRQLVLDTLSTDEYMAIDDIVTAIGDPDVTKNKVTARLTQLANMNMVDKTQLTVESNVEGGKTRKVSAYKRLA